MVKIKDIKTAQCGKPMRTCKCGNMYVGDEPTCWMPKCKEKANGVSKIQS